MDKQLYWERRKQGLRGQGDKPNTVVATHTPKVWKVLKRAQRLKKETK